MRGEEGGSVHAAFQPIPAQSGRTSMFQLKLMILGLSVKSHHFYMLEKKKKENLKKI